VTFDYVDDVVLTSVSPSVGPSSGGTTLRLVGSGFVFSPNLRVRFGLHSVPATYVSATEISCVTQASDGGDVSLSVSNNGVDYSSTTVQYTYRAVARVTSIAPQGGSVDGGTVVLVTGSDFVDSGSLACKFGDAAASAATFVSATSVRCVAPSGSSGSVAVEVSNNGADFTKDSVQFRYHASAAVSSLAPGSGPVSGGTVITVHGFNFVDSDALYCRFGGDGAGVTARWISSSKVECVAPAHALGSVSVEVTLNDADYTDDGISFTFVKDVLLTSIVPAAGPAGGDTLVTLSGSFVLNLIITVVLDPQSSLALCLTA